MLLRSREVGLLTQRGLEELDKKSKEFKRVWAIKAFGKELYEELHRMDLIKQVR